MVGASGLTDEVVRTAAGGAQTAIHRILEAMEPQVRLMVAARLSPTRAQYDAVEDIAQQSMLALMEGMPRLEQRTVGGLKAFASVIVRHKVSDLLKGRGQGPEAGPGARSLDSTAASFSTAGPLWQLLTAGLASPRTMAEQAEQLDRLMDELGRLKPEHREVITLAFFDQLGMTEIAAQMHTSRPAASMLLIRAVRALRRAMRIATQTEHPYGETTRK
jgi:RNA polymerase sigma factor (sigma-70 family)